MRHSYRISSVLPNRHLSKLFRSRFAENHFGKPQRGVTNRLRPTDANELRVPRSLLAEQMRIVLRISQLFLACNEREQRISSHPIMSLQVLEQVPWESPEGSAARPHGPDSAELLEMNA